MLVIHTVAACRRCRGTTMWRLDKGNGHCDRCHRKKCVPRRRPSPVHLGALFGLLVIVAAGVAFAFGESGHQPQIDQALELVLEEQSGKNGEATGADDSPFEITASSGKPGLAERLKSARYSDVLEARRVEALTSGLSGESTADLLSAGGGVGSRGLDSSVGVDRHGLSSRWLGHANVTRR